MQLLLKRRPPCLELDLAQGSWSKAWVTDELKSAREAGNLSFGVEHHRCHSHQLTKVQHHRLIAAIAPLAQHGIRHSLALTLGEAPHQIFTGRYTTAVLEGERRSKALRVVEGTAAIEGVEGLRKALWITKVRSYPRSPGAAELEAELLIKTEGPLLQAATIEGELFVKTLGIHGRCSSTLSHCHKAFN